MHDEVNFRLSKAKTKLVLDHPFIGAIALGLPTVLTDDIPTAATDGKRIMYSPKFIGTLNDAELLFLVAHECFHPMFEHCFRRGARDPRGWNIAADVVINQLLTEENIGAMPPTGILDPKLYNKGGGTAEGVYAAMPAEDKAGGTGLDGLFDVCEDAPGGEAEKAQQQAEWKIKVSQAAQAAKAAGQLSKNLERLVTQILAPRVDWRNVLRNFVSRERVGSRSFSRFNRRFLPQNIFLPAEDGDSLGDVCVAVDCSGSIDMEVLAQFAAELRAIKEDMNPRALHIIYFDSSVVCTDTFLPGDDLQITACGGGGTDFAPVFEHIATQEYQPVAIVVLTDLCCSSFGDVPEAPVLWVTTDKTDAPFGQIVKVDL
jgi:predicted metal-dependent peptidase